MLVKGAVELLMKTPLCEQQLELIQSLSTARDLLMQTVTDVRFNKGAQSPVLSKPDLEMGQRFLDEIFSLRSARAILGENHVVRSC